MRRRFGIRTRLFLAFGSVAATTVFACAAAWLSYARLGGSLAEMSGAHMPALELATRLAEEGGATRALAPLLVSAETEAGYQVARADLERRLAAMRLLLQRIALSEVDALHHPELTALVDAIEANFADLDQNVRQRFELTQQNRNAMARLRWLQADFLDEAEPLVEDARFNIRVAMDELEQGAPATTAVRLREEMGKAEAVLIANANANLLFGLLPRIATLASVVDLQTTSFFLTEMADLLEHNSAALQVWPDMVTLRQLTAQLLDLASTEYGLPALRQEEISTLQRGRALLEQNQALVNRLNGVIAERISMVSGAATAAAERSAVAIVQGRQLLLLLAAASLAVALAVAWFYVHRNLLRRLTALGSTARAIAAGDLRAPVPMSGND
ncbi:MAG TPA: histidine kinase, partial [Gammaproteobacteria bacterium]|nr:histidine kinase [Gammaproteobacteria bacterium]